MSRKPKGCKSKSKPWCFAKYDLQERAMSLSSGFHKMLQLGKQPAFAQRSSDVAQPLDAADWMATFFLPDGPSCNTSAAQPAQPATVGAPTQPVLCDFFQCNVWSSEKGGFLVGHCGLLRSWEYMPVKGQCAAGQKWEGLVRQMEVGERVALGYDTMLTR